LSVLLCGCGSANPQAVSDQIELKIRLGDIPGAAIQVDQALKRYSRGDPQWQWRFRILKSEVLVSQSDASGALAILDGDLPPQLVNTDLAIQQQLYRGIAERIAQHFDKSKEALSDAETLATQLHSNLLSRVLTAKGALEIDELDYDGAGSSYDRGIKIARQRGDEDSQAALLLDLGRLATLRRQFDVAIDQSEAALRLSRSLGKQSYVATILGNLGWSYAELGDTETSLEYFKEGAAESAKTGMSVYSAYWYSGVADSYMALHDYADAETLAQTTIRTARSLNNAQAITACLNTLARVMLLTNRLEQADQYIQEALKLENSGADKFGTLESLTLAGQIASAQKRFPEAESFFSRVLADPKAHPRFRWESEAGIAAVRDGENKGAEAEKLYKQAIDMIETARCSINHDELRLSFLSSGIEVYGQYVDFLVKSGKPAEALNQAELSRARALAEGLASGAVCQTSEKTQRVSPQEIAQKLRATLLFYWLGEERSYLWVVTPAKTSYFALPPAQEIDALVKSYRAAVASTRDPLAAGNPDGQKLYAMLVEPAKKSIAANGRVILLPDGSLYTLSFESLIVANPKPHYWIEDATLVTGSSLTLLAASAAGHSPKEKSLLLIGDTVQPSNEFPKLPQAPEEMSYVLKHFPETRRTVLAGPDATPSAYLNSKPEQYAYIHFVTHGTASRARPLESAVILSKDQQEEAYKLYAREIVKHRLAAHLVTISACNTSGSRTFSGEGVVGLSWAFLRAGAHNVIGALWEVNDNSTPQLMDTLYDHLSRGEDAATALRAAKLSLLHADSVFRKPLYWAPFQLYAGS
jgi:CHAT domain-containing protein/Tfp pilus assembly protein PilF